MYTHDITVDTVFIRQMPTDDDEKSTYFVDEKIEKGTRTIITTTDPLRAKLFTTKEVVEYTYNHMSETERKRLIEAHEKNESYGTLFARARDRFQVIVPESLGYGYAEDVKAEAKLLDQLDMAYIIGSEKLIMKDVDTL
jgi:hypothetical protein